MIRFLNVYYPTRTVILPVCEAIIVGSCFLLATLIVMGPNDAFISLNYESGWLQIAGVTFITLILSYYFDLYEPQLVNTRLDVYFRVLLVLAFDCFLISAAMYFFPELGISRYVPVLGFLLLTIALMLWRRAYDWIVWLPAFRERVYILGAGDHARLIVETLRTRSDAGMEVVDWQDLQIQDPAERRKHWVAELIRLANAKPAINRVIIAMEGQRGELPVQELLDLRFRGIVIEEAGTLRERLSGKIPLDGLRPSGFLYSEGFRIKPAQQLSRQVVSTLAAAIGLLSFVPFFPIVVLIIKLSSKGPIFFKQTRVGVGGRNFSVYKFRSMRTDAEAAGAKWAQKDDPRVYPFGRMMRKTRIDEIPQLWNVLRGDMGFVGPRPERPEFVPWLAEQLPFYNLRLLIRPGLTGWAQVRYGYGATLAESREKLEYDLYYVKHMSLGLDLLIMFETIKIILRRRGAQ
jgi:sugar transferase (PEP-CTERM system associated)